MIESPTVEQDFEMSEQVADIFAAIAKAQGEMGTAGKSRANPFFKSKYADLEAIKDASQEVMAKNGLGFISATVTRNRQAGTVSMLTHSSGQWLRWRAYVEPKDMGPQACGSAWTYLRRYGKQGGMDIATGDDDDAEAAEGRDKDAKPPGANWKRKDPPSPPQLPRHSNNDTGEVIDPGTLQDVRLAAGEKFKGKPKEAREWLFKRYGTENAAALTQEQGKDALAELRKAA